MCGAFHVPSSSLTPLLSLFRHAPTHSPKKPEEKKTDEAATKPAEAAKADEAKPAAAAASEEAPKAEETAAVTPAAAEETAATPAAATATEEAKPAATATEAAEGDKPAEGVKVRRKRLILLLPLPHLMLTSSSCPLSRSLARSLPRSPADRLGSKEGGLASIPRSQQGEARSTSLCSYWRSLPQARRQEG